MNKRTRNRNQNKTTHLLIAGYIFIKTLNSNSNNNNQKSTLNVVHVFRSDTRNRQNVNQTNESNKIS